MTIYKHMAEFTQYEADAHSVIKIHNLPNAILDRSNSPEDNWLRMPVTGRIDHAEPAAGRVANALPIMAYTWRLRPKGVPISGFRDIKG